MNSLDRKLKKLQSFCITIKSSEFLFKAESDEFKIQLFNTYNILFLFYVIFYSKNLFSTNRLAINPYEFPLQEI